MERKDIVFARVRDVISPLFEFYLLHEEHNLNLEQTLFKPQDHTVRGALLGAHYRQARLIREKRRDVTFRSVGGDVLGAP